MHFREVIEKYGYCFPSKDVANAIESIRCGATTYLNHFEGKNSDGTENKFRTRVFPRWKWLIDAPIKISAKCCAILKDKPFKKYQRETGIAPYVGLLATDSFRRRYSQYLSGNNSFSTKKSKPLSIWTEQDILRYIVDNKVKIPSCYGDIIVDSKGRLHTTKEKRTGCVFCPIGAHLDKPNRFQRIKETHPALYRYCMEDLGLESFLSTLGIEH